MASSDDFHATVIHDPRLVRHLLGHLPAYADWTVDLDPDPVADPSAIHGRVGQIVAITCPYRRDPAFDGWQPMRWAARTRIVGSTCSPDPARSVWPPSGSPVLLGFLLTLTDVDQAQPTN